MAEINPYTQSLAENIAIAEAQRRLTMGQQQAQRSQALARARALRGRQVLAEMAREAALNERAMATRQKVDEALAALDAQKKIEQSVGITGSIAKGLVTAAQQGLFDKPPEEKTTQQKTDEAALSLGSPLQRDVTLPLGDRIDAIGREFYDVTQMSDPAFRADEERKKREEMMRIISGRAYIPEMFE